MVDGQVLEQALDDEADLNMTFVGSDLASDLRPADLALATEVLIAVTATDASHVSHPEVIGIRADGAYSRDGFLLICARSVSFVAQAKHRHWQGRW
jgi:hypothetical protein